MKIVMKSTWFSCSITNYTCAALPIVRYLRCSTEPGLWFCGAGLSFLGLSPPSPAAAPSRSLHASGRTETPQLSRSGPFLYLGPAYFSRKRLVARLELKKPKCVYRVKCQVEEVLPGYIRVITTAPSHDWWIDLRHIASTLWLEAKK